MITYLLKEPVIDAVLQAFDQRNKTGYILSFKEFLFLLYR